MGMEREYQMHVLEPNTFGDYTGEIRETEKEKIMRFGAVSIIQ